LKQWKNEAEQRRPLVSKSLPIEDTLWYKILFFSGFLKIIFYFCKKINFMNRSTCNSGDGVESVSAKERASVGSVSEARVRVKYTIKNRQSKTV
jgi:hypothetical protein